MVHLDGLARDAPPHRGIRLAPGMAADECHRLEPVERALDGAHGHAGDPRELRGRERRAAATQEFPRLHRADAVEGLDQAGRADID